MALPFRAAPKKKLAAMPPKRFHEDNAELELRRWARHAVATEGLHFTPLLTRGLLH